MCKRIGYNLQVKKIPEHFIHYLMIATKLVILLLQSFF
jgi:hypothetical protein